MLAGFVAHTSPAFHGPLGDPQFFRDVRVLLTAGEAAGGLQPGLFAGLPLFGVRAEEGTAAVQRLEAQAGNRLSARAVGQAGTQARRHPGTQARRPAGFRCEVGGPR
ncbi:hypothetical protein GCM10010341_79790 [Streptomyces noursei]|nr:hypothetical protein GCM10010341_79790 [Streptomyces noursei]